MTLILGWKDYYKETYTSLGWARWPGTGRVSVLSKYLIAAVKSVNCVSALIFTCNCMFAPTF